MSGEQARAVADRLRTKLGDRVTEVLEDGRGVVIKLALEAVPEALAALKDDPETPFDLLADVTAIDWSTWAEQTGLDAPAARFSLLYNLYSIAHRERIFVEAPLADGEEAPSAAELFASANRTEREIWDMFGIRFLGHPDLRRILLSEYDEFHPLRKEYPRRGHDPQDFPQE